MINASPEEDWVTCRLSHRAIQDAARRSSAQSPRITGATENEEGDGEALFPPLRSVTQEAEANVVCFQPQNLF